ALRARKHREDKPFALMVADLAAARELCEVDETGQALLASARRPVVLLPRRPGAPAADAGAPGHRQPRLMLPYTPLHPPPRARGGPPCCRGGPAVLWSGPGERPRTSRSRTPTTTRWRGWAASPTRSSPTTARSTSAPTTRWCGRCGAGKRCCAGPAATPPSR